MAVVPERTRSTKTRVALDTSREFEYNSVIAAIQIGR